jgi:hypothetical protein
MEAEDCHIEDNVGVADMLIWQIVDEVLRHSVDLCILMTIFKGKGQIIVGLRSLSVHLEST